jgi:hypothetical protein
MKLPEKIRRAKSIKEKFNLAMTGRTVCGLVDAWEPFRPIPALPGNPKPKGLLALLQETDDSKWGYSLAKDFLGKLLRCIEARDSESLRALADSFEEKPGPIIDRLRVHLLLISKGQTDYPEDDLQTFAELKKFLIYLRIIGKDDEDSTLRKLCKEFGIRLKRCKPGRPRKIQENGARKSNDKYLKFQTIQTYRPGHEQKKKERIPRAGARSKHSATAGASRRAT